MWNVRRYFILLLLLSSLVLAACGEAEPVATATVIPSATQTEIPATPTITPTLFPTATNPPPTIAITPRPSPTPMIYAAVEGDTMIGIAVRFGLTLEELQTANPEVDPQFLSIGTELTIPVFQEEGEEPVVVSKVPEELKLEQVNCSDQPNGEVVCLYQVKNGTELTYENVLVQIYLADSSGEVVATQTTYLPLNLLIFDQVMPGWVSFEGLAGSWNSAGGVIISGLPDESFPDLERYVIAGFDSTQRDIQDDHAIVRGEFHTDRDASVLWMLAAAYDDSGRVVAVRRWEWQNIEADNHYEYQINLYSKGESIESAEIWLEARP